MYSDVTVILKHFMRENYTRACIESLKQYEGIKIFVACDSHVSHDFDSFLNENTDLVLKMPFDSGLPAGRNRLLEKVQTKFFLIGDDDFFYESNTDLSKLLKLMDIADIAGGAVQEDGILKHYEGFFVKDEKRTIEWKRLDVSSSCELYEGIQYKKCDFVFNFFIAKKEISKKVQWDEHIKISYEHSDFFLMAKDADIKVVYCPEVVVTHKPAHIHLSPEEGAAYDGYRRRRGDRNFFLKKWGYETYIDIHGHHDRLTRNEFQVDATKCLRDAKHVLNKMRMKWWCEAGTCLGVMREKDFVPHDSDIDIGVLDNKRIGELRQNLLDNGFEFVHEFGTPDNGFEFAFRKYGVKIDFFWFYDQDGKMWHSAWLQGEQLFYDFPPHLFVNLKEVEFQGMNVWVPNPPEEYLTIRYGDWEEVKKEWDWAHDPLCKRK